MTRFKMLNSEVEKIVEKLGKAAPNVIEMDDIKLQEINEAIQNTIKMIKDELHITQNALSEVIKAVQGEIARRGISKKVDKQLSIFDGKKLLEVK